MKSRLKQTQTNILIVENTERRSGPVNQLLARPDMSCEIEKASSMSVAQNGRNGKRPIDLILFDLHSSSREVINAVNDVRAQEPHVPFIIIANDDDELATSAAKKVAQDLVLRSELNAALLVRAIRYAVERNELIQRLHVSREVEQFRAYQDGLTGLPNRHLFYDHLKRAILQAQRYEQQIALLFVDLDGFKNLNDKLGHTAGDLILQEAAERLSRIVRKSDTVARWGGDEFALILNRISEPNDASKVAEKIVEEFSVPFCIAAQEFSVTTSIGISLFPSDATEEEGLIKKADIALCRAKSLGQNSWHNYDASWDKSFLEHRAQIARLRRAIDEDELAAYFQPQIDVASGEIMGVEAFVRWHHPELGVVEPSEFMPLAAETGLILDVDEWMLRTVCKQIQALREIGLPPIRVSVNLSAQLLRDEGFPHLLNDILEDTRFDPTCLVLEITQDYTMDDLELSSSTIQKFKQLGVQIAYHQFGTGYSSLAHLMHLPKDILKIDRSLVQGIADNEEDETQAMAIMAMAQSLKLKVIAEGVETEEQLAYLSKPGCDEIQGFYVSQPVPADSLFTFLISQLYMTGQVAQA